MANREKLLGLVSGLVRNYFGVDTAVERDEGDYEFAGMLDRQGAGKGKPVTAWTFSDDESRSEPFAGQKSSGLYFHIDEANNRALLVNPPRALSGGGYIIDGESETYCARWRS